LEEWLNLTRLDAASLTVLTATKEKRYGLKRTSELRAECVTHRGDKYADCYGT
jgi:hypothetical protein